MAERKLGWKRSSRRKRNLFVSFFFLTNKVKNFSEIKKDLLSFAIASRLSCCIEKLEVISKVKVFTLPIVRYKKWKCHSYVLRLTLSLVDFFTAIGSTIKQCLE